jgi:hypothetical protein
MIFFQEKMTENGAVRQRQHTMAANNPFDGASYGIKTNANGG